MGNSLAEPQGLCLQQHGAKPKSICGGTVFQAGMWHVPFGGCSLGPDMQPPRSGWGRFHFKSGSCWHRGFGLFVRAWGGRLESGWGDQEELASSSRQELIAQTAWRP